jgi:hypothetical protein
LIEGGAELELGWLPPLLDNARNGRIAAGAPGRVVASQGIRMLEVPLTFDRSKGDIHPLGNPHFMLDPLNAKLIAAAVRHVGHPAIRSRGTLGGSLALADPAAELPACAVALDAMIGVMSRRGGRDIAAADFFRGIYTTVLEPGEVVTAITVPRAAAGWRWGFEELARRHGDFALAGLAAGVRFEGEAVAEARLVSSGRQQARSRPGGAALPAGARPEALAAAGRALDGDLDPPGDVQVAGPAPPPGPVLLARAWWREGRARGHADRQRRAITRDVRAARTWDFLRMTRPMARVGCGRRAARARRLTARCPRLPDARGQVDGCRVETSRGWRAARSPRSSGRSARRTRSSAASARRACC